MAPSPCRRGARAGRQSEGVDHAPPFLTLCAAAVALLIASPALGQPACYERDVYVAYIKERYGLSMASWGLDDFGVMRELLMSESGQFAVVTTPPSGCSTAIIVTAHWERLVRPWEDADDRTVPPEQTGPQTFRKPKPYRGRPL